MVAPASQMYQSWSPEQGLAGIGRPTGGPELPLQTAGPNYSKNPELIPEGYYVSQERGWEGQLRPFSADQIESGLKPKAGGGIQYPPNYVHPPGPTLSDAHLALQASGAEPQVPGGERPSFVGDKSAVFDPYAPFEDFSGGDQSLYSINQEGSGFELYSPPGAASPGASPVVPSGPSLPPRPPATLGPNWSPISGGGISDHMIRPPVALPYSGGVTPRLDMPEMVARPGLTPTGSNLVPRPDPSLNPFQPTMPEVQPPSPPVSPRPEPQPGIQFPQLPTGQQVSNLAYSEGSALRPPSLRLKHGGSLTDKVLRILRNLL